MKRSKKMILLLCVLAVVCIATVVMTNFDPEQEQIEATNEVILSLSSGSITRLSWDGEETALAFHRDEENVWHYDEDDTFPVDQEEMDVLLAEFGEVTANFVIDDVTDYSQYGLDDPVCIIDFSTDTQDYTVKLGAYSEIDGLRYVSIGDGKVYLVTQDPAEAFGVVLSDLFLHDTMPEIETVTKISFAGMSKDSIVYKEDGGASYNAEDVWYLNGLPLDTALVESYLSAFTGVSLTNCVSHDGGADSLVTYHLDEPALSVTVSYTTEESDGTNVHRSAVLHLSSAVEVGDDTAAYVRIGDSKLIYQITESAHKTLTSTGYNDLRHKEVFTADFETVTGVDITLEGSTYSLTKHETVVEAEEEDGEDTTKILWKYGETEVQIDDIQSALEDLTAGSFTADAPTGKEEIRVVIHMENDYSDTMEIVLYRQDGDTCLCEVNGESICFVSRSSVVELIEAVNAIVL